MFLKSVTETSVVQALTRTLAFQESRLKVIAENVANIQTPGYRAKQVDPKAFQGALRKALDAFQADREKPFAVQSGSEVTTDAAGRLVVTPSEKPVDNVLFHDGTNLSVEREMADLAKTALSHEQATSLLRTHFDGLRRAIRGAAG